MQMIKARSVEDPTACPYLPGRQKRYEYFLASDLGRREIAALLAHGWRKFGIYFFRPACPDCRQCIPLRVDVAAFQPSRSQRRVERGGEEIDCRFGPLRPDRRVFDIYAAHSAARFGLASDFEEFLLQFYLPACPSLQSELSFHGRLIAAGFLDLGSDCLSSIYFCFDPAHSAYRPGILGALREIEHARHLGLRWYYLGYFVPGSPALSYKDHFRPRQYFDWEKRRWRMVTAPPAGLTPPLPK
jgi:leucyl-tRNA---protein transferase